MSHCSVPSTLRSVLPRGMSMEMEVLTLVWSGPVR
jgi:hypothetical protein